MKTVSTISRIREMSPEEIQEHYDRLCEKCNGEVLQLSEDEFRELRACADNYYQITGRAITTKQTSDLEY